MIIYFLILKLELVKKCGFSENYLVFFPKTVCSFPVFLCKQRGVNPRNMSINKKIRRQ